MDFPVRRDSRNDEEIRSRFVGILVVNIDNGVTFSVNSEIFPFFYCVNFILNNTD
jgi:hypothetical protein